MNTDQQWLNLGPRVGSIVEIDGGAAGVKGRIRCRVITHDVFEEETGQTCRNSPGQGEAVVYPLKVMAWPDLDAWPASAPRFVAARDRALKVVRW